jgi:hypothetical protein
MPNDTEANDVDVRQYEGVRGALRFPYVIDETHEVAHTYGAHAYPTASALMHNTNWSIAGRLDATASPRLPTVTYSRR